MRSKKDRQISKDNGLSMRSEEDRQMLSAYHHSFDDEKVDIDLITELIFKIHSSCKDGNLH